MMLVTLVSAFTAVFGIANGAAMPQTPKGGDLDGTALIGGLLKGMGGSVPHGPAPKGCSKYELLVARGTGEPGPFGSIVGDPLVATVTKLVPDSRGYAVQYPANFNLSLSPATGADDTITRLNTQNKACPDQKFALVGYSQGAGVMHGAMASSGKPIPGLPSPRPILDQSVISKIVAVVMFGDPAFKGGPGIGGTTVPEFPSALQKVLMENCAPGDPVCDPKGTGFQYHLKYNGTPYQPNSVAFIEAGFKGLPLPKAIKSSKDAEWIAFAAKGTSKV